MLETFIPISSNLDRVDYESDTGEMTVAFNDGSEYAFHQVPHTVFLGIQNAASPGAYFHRNIKGRYAYEEL